MNSENIDFHLRVTDNGTALLLDCDVTSQNIDMLVARIESECSELGIAEPPSREQLEERLRLAAQSGAPLKDEALVESQPLTPPKDGVLTWDGDFFSSDFMIDEKTDAVDYRQRAGRRAVEDGQLLAHLTHPEKGRPGLDVFGRPIPVKNPQRNMIRVGTNVRADKQEDAIYFYATSSGRIRWAAETLAVDNVYTIEGDVCMDTGHIDHPGELVVNGDVLAGFKVHAHGNIEIMGVVEPTDIRAGGDLTVHGGITGAEGNSIKVEGSIEAKYILDANIEAGEDVVVKNEIIHSHVKTRGAVVMPAGRLIGGETSALRGITVGQAGSDANVPTLIVSAEDHGLEEKLHLKEQEIATLDENFRKIHQTVDPLMSREEDLASKQRELVTELLSNAAKMEESVKQLRAEIEAIKMESRKRADPRISIRGNMYSETTLRIKETALLINDTQRGPTTAVLENDKIVLKVR